MSLCSVCQAVLCEIFSRDTCSESSLRIPLEALKRWYQFPPSNDCNLCRMMDAEISRDMLQSGLAKISFRGSRTLVEGSIQGVGAFYFSVQIEQLELASDLPTDDIDFIEIVDEPNASRNHHLMISKGASAIGFTWSGAQVLSEPQVQQFWQQFKNRRNRQSELGNARSKARCRKGGTGRERAFLARNWIDICHDQHSLCKPRQWCSFLPTRLIDVEENRLIETRQLTGPVKYIALTHCWGPEMPETAMTKAESLVAYKHKIILQELPNTFRDAIIVTKNLRIRYIWIDSLCIIQDSIQDWEAESARMGLIYSYAWCTIAASSAKSCHDGMDLVRKEVEIPCQVILQDNQGRRVQINISPSPPSWEKFYNANPLNKRGWTFQERELSPRVLHFSVDQLWWECRTLRKQEDSVPDIDLLTKKWEKLAEKKIVRDNIKNAIIYSGPPVNQAIQLRCLDNMLQRGTPTETTSILHKFVVTEARYNTWHRIIEDYSIRTFSRITDRFPALSGLASEMQAAYGGEYVAGMWRDDLLRSLLWRRMSNSAIAPFTNFRGSPDYRAPSWSWAAIDEAVTYDLVVLNRPQIDQTATTTAHVEAINLVPKGSDPKGRLKDGFITIRSKLKLYELSNVSRSFKFHLDFDLDSDVEDEISIAPIFLLSLFVEWALALVMVVEDPEPVFRRVGVTSDVSCEWFKDAMDVRIKII